MTTRLLHQILAAFALITTVTSQTVVLPWSCDFELAGTFCSGLQQQAGPAQWTRQNGASPSSGTGPEGPNSGAYYALFESSSPRAQGDQAILYTLPILANPGTNLCISFYYSTYGIDLVDGALTVHASTIRNGGTVRDSLYRWTRTFAAQGWQFASLAPYTVREPNTRIEFTATRGIDYRSDIGLDTVEIRECAGRLPYTCTYEEGFCDQEQSTDDQFDWTRTNTATGTSDTGPGTGQGGSGWYMYTEASSPRRPGDRARIELPSLEGNAFPLQVCLQYYYHMWGVNEMGTLNILTRQRTGIPWQTRTGDQGNDWRLERVTLTMQSASDRVIFEGIVGSGIRSDIAVDTVSMTAGSCTINTPTLLTCSFEQADICGFSQVRDTDVFDWTRQQGATPSQATGPSQAFDGGWYMFTEVSNRNNGNNARLLTPVLNYVGQVCLTFRLHMFGSSMGTLAIYSTQRPQGGVNNPWTTITGNQGNVWVEQKVDIFLYDDTDRIGFDGRRGTGVEGDISIDLVTVETGTCTGTPPPTPPPPTPPPPTTDLFTCDFENNCGITQRVDDRFDWIILSGPTNTANTGPSNAQSGTYYWYMEATGRAARDNAVIELPALNYVGPVCLTFYYHMWGDQQGVLWVYTTRRTISNPWQAIFGDKGNAWQLQTTTIQLESVDDRIGFFGQLGGGERSDIAIDNIRVRRGACAGTTPPPTSTVPFYCDFEFNNFCGITQRANSDQFNWQIISGSTPTSGTGPTSARTGSYYLYAEADNRNQGDRAIIEVPALNYIGAVCLTYYFHVWGEGQGSFFMGVTDNTGAANTIRSVTGNQGNQWTFDRVTINLNANDRVFFTAQRGFNQLSDIAIDDVRIEAGACPGTPPPSTGIPYACGFESNLAACSIEQSTTDSFDWSLRVGSTPTQDTGPQAARQGSQYLYMEADGQSLGNSAVILLPTLNYIGTVCLTYSNHMFGINIGSLDVFTTQSNIDWKSHNGNSRINDWIPNSVTIDINSNTDRIGFRARRGNGIFGDIAIDDVRVVAGSCQGTPPPPTAVTLPFVCDLEVANLCGIMQSTSDVFDWTRFSGSTPTQFTGPSFAQSGVYYLYAEADGRTAGQNAILLIPPINFAGTVCLSMYVHMRGTNLGSLSVLTLNGDGSNPQAVYQGNQGDQWLLRRVSMPITGATDRIMLNAVIGNGVLSDIAVDSIRVEAGSCAGTTPPPTPINLPFVCDLEASDLCGVSQSTNDQFDWTQNAGSTPTPSTGPGFAQSGNYYLYAEADGRNQGDTAVGSIPSINYVGNVCLTFYYHMWGVNVGTLTVFTTTNTWAQITGNQGNQWRERRVTIDLRGSNDRIGFRAERGNGIFGDIAIDTLRVEQGSCTGEPPVPQPVNLPFSCDLEESSLCQLRGSTSDNFDWTRNTGSTPTPSTGPTSAQSGIFYLFAEADDRRNGDTATELLPPINYVGSVCLSFYYHMYGVNQGSLYVSTQNQNTRWTTLTGNKGNQWNLERVTVDNRGPTDRIGITAVRGNGIFGDIAIDNIRVTQGSCGETPPPSRDLPYFCDFGVNDICGITQIRSDRFDWDVYIGSTPTANTGPTAAQSGLYYFYMEADGKASGDNAIIELPPFNYVGRVCLLFYYHMWGSTQGVLYVTTSTRTVVQPWRTFRGNRGNQWNFEQVAIDLSSSSDKIGFYGQIGSDRFSDIAIDNIRVNAGDCTTNNLVVDCSFENNQICGFIQRTNDQFDWSTNSFGTDTANTGPTGAIDGTWYLYTEASFPRNSFDRAIIQTPSLQYSGPACVTFWYNMNGAGIGRLIVYQSNVGEGSPLFQQRGPTGNQWIQISRDVTLNFGESIVFVGELGSTQRELGDIAIDNVRVRSGSCSATGVITTCGFENNQLCELVQRTDDQFDWTPRQFTTDTPNTGPSGAIEGTWYLYIESSFRNPFDRAMIETRAATAPGPVCVRFWYNMNGAGIGRLIVYQTNLGEGSPLFQQRGPTGNQWIEITRDATLATGERIVFVGEVGNSQRELGDIALDNIRVTQGVCSVTPPPPVTPPPSTPPPETLRYFTCDMETDGQFNSQCRIKNYDTVDRPQMFFVQGTGRTPSGDAHTRDGTHPVTGPDGAAQGASYLYVESSRRSPGDIARMIIEGSDARRAGDNCLRFKYSMNGYNTGSLRVFKRSSGPREYLWSMSGDKEWFWYSASVNVNGNGISELGLEVEVTGEFNSDIAVDDIRYTQGKCQNIPSPYVWWCNFELSDQSSTMCEMTQDTTDNYDWTLWKGETPSDETGPDRAFNGEYYLYSEGSKPRQTGDVARIITPSLDASNDICVEFYYSMRGFHMGSLNVYVADPSGNRRPSPQGGLPIPVYTISGNQQEGWRQRRQTVNNFRFRDKVVFEAVQGTEFSSDLAIDNLRISPGRCL